MFLQSVTLASLLASTAFAHFRVPFPGERNATNWDTQTTAPCGGDNFPVLPRFEWNPKGSPLEINYHHTYGVGAIFFCGSGNCTTGDDFDELVYEPVDQTAGNFCIPALQLPSKYNNVNNTGVIQIIYADATAPGAYTYMYNCVDVIVSEDGPVFDGQCSNSTDNKVEYDTGVASVEAANDNEEFDKVGTLTYLDAAISSVLAASSAASTTGMSGMDMDGMSGMDMGGMTGMDMSTATTSSVLSAKASRSNTASTTVITTGSTFGSSSTSSTGVSTAGAAFNGPGIAGIVALAVGVLYI